MLIVTVVVIGLVLGIAVRQVQGPDRRVVLGVAALALGVRFASSVAIYLVSRQTHPEGVWLNDEASFWLATESLMHDPLNSALPLGLDHLGGDGYLGLTTVISMLFGSADSNAFRFINSGIGATVVLLSVLIARRMFGLRAAVVAGLGIAVWPSLVLWSATMLRDTLGSLMVVVVWWTLFRARELGTVRTVSTVFLAVVTALSLRPYVGTALLAGVLAWWAYPHLRRLPRTGLASLAAAVVVVAVVLGITQARRVDFTAHELLYRQTVTRMETLGLLYTDAPPETANLPIKPGSPVAIADPRSGWLLTGVVQDVPAPGVARVAFVDESIRTVSLSDVQLIQDTRIPPLQLLAWVMPSLTSLLIGTSMTSDPGSPVWVVSSLAWDALLIVAVVVCIRQRVSPRDWLFPLCVVGGTMLALIAVPGAPGNADRHRTTQTVPLLLVLASGLAVSRLREPSGVAVTSMNARPAKEPTPAISRMRSAR